VLTAAGFLDGPELLPYRELGGSLCMRKELSSLALGILLHDLQAPLYRDREGRAEQALHLGGSPEPVDLSTSRLQGLHPALSLRRSLEGPLESGPRYTRPGLVL
jgi:hypothetical protein